MALAVLLAAPMLIGALPAAANDLDNLKSIELNVHGRIAEHCSMGQIADINFGDITRVGLQATAKVQLSCNVPFDMKIQSANGGLANDQFPHGQGPYAGTLPYTIGVSMPLRKPQTSFVDRTFKSNELTGGRTISSDGGIALDGFGLTVALGRPSNEAGLLAGKYGETIVITVTPS